MLGEMVSAGNSDDRTGRRRQARELPSRRPVPAMTDIVSVTRRLEGGYHSLPPQLRKAARYVVKAPTEIALYSLREVAARAEVGPTTLVRLAAQLGFASYNAFRETFREGLRS